MNKIYLGKQPVAGCIACRKCVETGYCFREDAVRGASGQLVSFLKRLFFATEKRMAGKLGVYVVSCRRGVAAQIY